jgi:hypothetical protein
LARTAAKLLGETVAADIPVALEHQVEEVVAKPHSVLHTAPEKAATAAVAAAKRAASADKKQRAVEEAAKSTAPERIKESTLFVCRIHPDGDPYCNRSFFQQKRFLAHLAKGEHTSGLMLPWETSTTRMVPVGAAAVSEVSNPKRSGEVREKITKAAQIQSTEHQRWPLEYSRRVSTESGSAMANTPSSHEGWAGEVSDPSAGLVTLEPVSAGAGVSGQIERTGGRTAAQYSILIACLCVGGGEGTQKLNHWTVAGIMQEACTPEGVAKVALEFPKLTLFVEAASHEEMLLPTRLDALDANQAKPYLSKTLNELRELRKSLEVRAAKKLANLREHRKRRTVLAC